MSTGIWIVAALLVLPFVLAAIVAVQKYRPPRALPADPPILAPLDDVLGREKGRVFAELIEAEHELTCRRKDPAALQEEVDAAGVAFMDKVAVAKELGVLS